MKRALLAMAFIATLSAPALASEVGVSVSIGHPDFYGRIDVGGGYPPPLLVNPRPMLIEPAPPGRPPVYLRVPPGHAQHWERHCREYNACGEPVYFVDDGWYSHEYAPRYREWRGDRREGDGDRRYRDNYRRDDRHDERDDHDRGRGRGHGRDD